MSWIDEEGNLLRGVYRGESLEDVAAEDLNYLKGLLEEVPLETEERAAVATVVEAFEATV